MTWSKASRHTRGYGSRWDKLRKRILQRDNFLCQPCLAKGVVHPATEVDHRTPKSRGGTDEESNLWAINEVCHREKTAQESAEARGRTYKRKPAIGLDGWPIDN